MKENIVSRGEREREREREAVISIYMCKWTKREWMKG